MRDVPLSSVSAKTSGLNFTDLGSCLENSENVRENYNHHDGEGEKEEEEEDFEN